jgi:hypothetical protein
MFNFNKDTFNVFCTFILSQFDNIFNILKITEMNRIDAIWTILLFLVGCVILGALVFILIIPLKIGKIIYFFGFVVVRFLNSISSVFSKPVKKYYASKNYFPKSYGYSNYSRNYRYKRSKWIPYDQYKRIQAAKNYYSKLNKYRGNKK